MHMRKMRLRERERERQKESEREREREREREGCSRPAEKARQSLKLPLRSCTLHTHNCSGKKLPRNRQKHTLNLID